MHVLDVQKAQQALDEADCLFDESRMAEVFDRMAEKITAKLREKNPLVLAVLNGGIVATGQLLPRLRFPLQVSYLHATRYGNEINGQQLVWKVRPEQPVRGRVVLVIDDVLDEGKTLAAIIEHVRAEGAASVHCVVVVNKLHPRKAIRPEEIDFIGINVEDRFLFGCGMDYNGYWRNTLGIYAVRGL